MTRSRKQIDGIEDLKRQIKERDAKIKELKRTIANFARVEPKIEKNIDFQPKKEKPLPKTGKHIPLSSIYKCPDCGGSLQNIELGIRTITHCISCGYKVTIKNDKKEN